MKKIFLITLLLVAVTAFAADWNLILQDFTAGGEKPETQKYTIKIDGDIWHLMCRMGFENSEYVYPCYTSYLYRDVDNNTVILAGDNKLICTDVYDNGSVKNCYAENMKISVLMIKNVQTPPDEADNGTDNETE